jgi:diamine N-acetyltransferase
MKVSIKPVDENNWEEIVALKISPEQIGFVATNVYSLADAAYGKASVPLGIFNNDEAVGFVMYESLAYEGKPGEYSIFRFMIDEKHQNKGYGRLALKETISQITTFPDCNRITICYLPSNAVAKSFYESVGFTEFGIDDSGEMLAEIKI